MARSSSGKARPSLEVGPIRAVVVFSESPRSLAQWYRRCFACSVINESDGFVGLNLGGFALFLQRSAEGHSPGVGGIRPHLTVSDCQAAFAQLKAAGARAVLPPTKLGRETVAAVLDPEGNPLGLLSLS